MRTSPHKALTLLMAVGLVAGGGGVAHASSVQSDSDVALINQVAPEALSDTADSAVTGDAVVSRVDAENVVAVTVPSDTAGDITVSAPAESDISAEGMNRAPESLELQFSADAAVGEADVATGILSFDNADGNSRTLVQPTSDGVTYYSVMESSDAPSRFAYTVTDADGLEPALFDDGIAALVDEDGVPRFVTARPWARDASGRELPTHFEWSGTTLTQIIDAEDRNVDYPVIADPAWSYAFSVTANVHNGGGTRDVSSRQAINELHRCFNCSFPVNGAPSRFPSVGQRLNLNASLWTAIKGPNAPVSVTQTNGAGFGFKSLSGHFDGAGSTIDFSFGGTRTKLVLSVRARVVRDRGAAANSANRAAAQAVWTTFVNKTSCNAIRYQQKRTC